MGGRQNVFYVGEKFFNAAQRKKPYQNSQGGTSGSGSVLAGVEAWRAYGVLPVTFQ
jgi:hypothetical protein